MNVRERVNALRNNSHFRNKYLNQLFSRNILNGINYQKLKRHCCLNCGNEMSYEEREPSDRITPRAMHPRCFRSMCYNISDTCMVCGDYLPSDILSLQKQYPMDIHHRFCSGKCQDYFSLCSCYVLGDDMSFIADVTDEDKTSYNPSFGNRSNPIQNLQLNSGYNNVSYQPNYNVNNRSVAAKYNSNQPINQYMNQHMNQHMNQPVNPVPLDQIETYKCQYRDYLKQEEEYHTSCAVDQAHYEALMRFHKEQVEQDKMSALRAIAYAKSTIEISNRIGGVNGNNLSKEMSDIAYANARYEVLEEMYPSGNMYGYENVLSSQKRALPSPQQQISPTDYNIPNTYKGKKVIRVNNT